MGDPQPESVSENSKLEPVTVVLSEEVYEALQEIAQKRGGIDIGEALKEAIGSDLFILREAANGSKILIKRPDRSVEELDLAVSG